MGGLALAQPCQIDPAIPAEMALNDAQRQAIAACAQQNAADLSSDDPEKRKAARKALLAPLQGPNVSAAFRIEYAKALEAVLRTVAANPDDRIAVGAYIIAGDLATEVSTGSLSAALASPRPALRFQAAYGLRRTFEAAVLARPAINADRVNAAIVALRGAAAKEQDGQVLKECVGAILAAASLSERDFPVARSEAAAGVCIALSENIKARVAKLPDQSTLEAYHKAVRGVRDIFTQPDARMTAASANAAAELSGRIIALAVRTANKNELQSASEASHAEVANAVASSETLIQLAGEALAVGTKVPEVKLGDKLRRGTKESIAEFILTADRQLIGADGALTKAPFSFTKTHFLP